MVTTANIGTPEPLCNMMASMVLGDIQDGKTVCDPACGSGRMLLAAARLNRHARFYGADLDNTCCKLSLLNMMLNSLTGEIAHMNTLSNEFYTGYKCCSTVVGSHHIPYYIEFTDAQQSYIWLQDLKADKDKSVFTTPFEPIKSSQPINGVQGSLF